MHSDTLDATRIGSRITLGKRDSRKRDKDLLVCVHNTSHLVSGHGLLSLRCNSILVCIDHNIAHFNSANSALVAEHRSLWSVLLARFTAQPFVKPELQHLSTLQPLPPACVCLFSWARVIRSAKESRRYGASELFHLCQSSFPLTESFCRLAAFTVEERTRSSQFTRFITLRLSFNSTV